MRIPLTILAAAALAGADPIDPLTALPVLPVSAPALQAGPLAATGAIVVLAPGVRIVPGRMVLLDGVMQVDQGPTDGLEVIACLRDGKTHETMVRLDTDAAAVVKAGVLAALGPQDGQTTAEGSGVPARGTPMRVRVHWQEDDGTWRSADASTLVRDRVVDRPYPPLPYIYTGSHERVVQETGPDGAPLRRVRFMLENSKTVVGNYDEPDMLLASPFPGAVRDDRFEVHSAVAPFARTRVQVSIEPATLPLTLSADGESLHDQEGQRLGDAMLEALLARHYGTGAAPELRAVAVAVAPGSARDIDVRLRERILAAAARARAWVVPVFTLQPVR
ncbi:MAG: hypothetical protein RLZZ127_74 [Planctomycetota bacterium]|jgi:hypothetical protein